LQVGQLFDNSLNVPWTALDLLDEACDDKMNLEAVVCAMGEFFKTTTLYPGRIRSHDPYAPRWRRFHCLLPGIGIYRQSSSVHCRNNGRPWMVVFLGTTFFIFSVSTITMTINRWKSNSLTSYFLGIRTHDLQHV
jgi:hypothetical protein